MLDYGAIATLLLDIARKSPSPEQGWTALVQETARHGAVPPELRGWDVGEDTALLRGEVIGVLEREPVPPEVGFIYFGLFDAWDEETDDPVAGFYVAGGTGNDPLKELSEGRPRYLPESRYFAVPLLDAIQAAPARGEYDDLLMQYALIWAAAALLVKHATDRLLDRYTVVVGFDEGDRTVLRTPDE
jgi:hypothetical protein